MLGREAVNVRQPPWGHAGAGPPAHLHVVLRGLLARVVLGRYRTIHPELHRHWKADLTLLGAGVAIVACSVLLLVLQHGASPRG